MDFVPAQLLTSFHGIKHVTYKLSTLPANETSGAGFVPWESDYLSVVYFFAGVSLVGLVLAMLASFIACCCSFCCSRRQHTYSLVGEPAPTYLRVTVTLAALLALGSVGGALYTMTRLHHGFNAGADQVADAITYIQAVPAQLMMAGANTGPLFSPTIVIHDTAVLNNDTAAPLESMNKLVAQLNAFNSTAYKLAPQLPSLNSTADAVSTGRRRADLYVFTPLYTLTGLTAVVALFAMAGTCCRSRCFLALAMVLGSLVLLAAWVASGVWFPAALAGADACVDPTPFITAHVPNDVVNFYLECTTPDASYYAADVQTLDNVYAEAATEIQRIQEFCVATEDPDLGEPCDAFAAALPAWQNTRKPVTTVLTCAPLNAFYSAALTSVCNETGVWAVYAVGIYGGLAVAASLLMVLLPCLYPRALARGRRGDGDYDDDGVMLRDEDQPLLGSRGSVQQAGGSRRGGNAAELQSPARASLASSANSLGKGTPGSASGKAPLYDFDETSPGGTRRGQCQRCKERPATGQLVPCGHAQCRPCVDRALASGRCRECWARVNGVNSLPA